MQLFKENEMLKSLEMFVEEIAKKHNVENADKEAISEMIVEEIKSLANKNNLQSLQVDDTSMENAVVKAFSLVDEWKKSKEKNKTKAITKPVTSHKSKDAKPKIAKPITEIKENYDKPQSSEIELSLFDF